MKHIILISCIASAVILAQCSSSRRTLAAPAAIELSVAQARWPESTAQSLEDGYTIYTSRCSKCHDLKDIPSMSEQDWIKSIASMAPKARLSEAEKITLEHYILATREAAAVRK